MNTSDEILVAIEQASKRLDAIHQRFGDNLWLVVHPMAYARIDKAIAFQRGCPMGKHLRARGIRGRKRALMRSWRSVRPPAVAIHPVVSFAKQAGMTVVVKP